MDLRNFCHSFVRIAALIISPFVILVLFTPITNLPLYLNLWGIGLGMCLALSMAVKLHNEFMIIRFPNNKVFESHMNIFLRQLGYERLMTEGAKITFRGTPRANLFAGDIEVMLYNRKALIIAPKVYLKRFVKLLPLTNISLVDQSWSETIEELNIKKRMIFYYNSDRRFS